MNSIRSTLEMPYPGLRPFESEDEPIFFGREAQVSVILRQLEDHRFVAVVGSSGSGKSSLVRAGLLPAIRDGFLLGCTSWLLLVIKPGGEPYRRLAHTLSRALASLEGTAAFPSEGNSEDHLLTTLHISDRGLFEALSQSGLPFESRVMVVIDQFEELFAFRRATAIRGDVAVRDEAAGFVSMLLRTASNPEARVWVLLTMRSDFIGDCETFLGLPEAVSRSQFLVPRLDRRQMEDAIRRPGEVREAAFRPFTFEEGLVNRIINEAGDRPDQLPLLQHALMHTWKCAVKRAGQKDSALWLTNDDYRAAGGIEQALSHHADTAWAMIANDPKQARIAHRLFLLLCDVSPDGQITRRRPKLAEVAAVTGASVEEIEQVVRIFQDDDRNFLLPAREEKLSSDTFLDVSHEALLRQWQRFANEWLVEERSDAEELRRLVQQAKLRGKQAGDVLGPKDLERIRDWRKRVSPEWALRYVTKEAWEKVLDFVQESEAEADRKRKTEVRQSQVRKALLFLVGFVLVAATITSVSFCTTARSQAIAAEQARRNAEEALTQSFVRTIGVSGSYRPSTDEWAALWELSELEVANQNVRKKVIDTWGEREDFLLRALRHGSRGLHAAIGLNSALADYFDSRAAQVTDSLAKELENPQETNSERLSSLSDALIALAALMNSDHAAKVANGLTKALRNPRETNSERLSNLGDALVAVAARMNSTDAAVEAARGAVGVAKALQNRQETNSERLSSLSDALIALAALMNSDHAAKVANGLTKALENPQETNSERLSNLAKALAALAAHMNPEDAATVASRLAKALRNPQEANSERLSSLVKALAAFAARMNSDRAAEVATGVAKALENPQEYSDRLSSLAKALAALAAHMNPDDAASLAARGAMVPAKMLENPQETYSLRLSTLADVVAALAALMNPEGAASVASGLAKALENPQETNSVRLSGLANALPVLAARMNPSEAASIATGVAQALENPQETNSVRLSSLAKALAGFAARMNPDDAAEVATVLAKVLENQETNSDRLSSLANALPVLVALMNPEDAASVASGLAKALENPQETNSYRLSSLAKALVALAARMNPEGAASMASGLAKALENPQERDSDRLSSLANALAALAARMNPSEAASIATGVAQALENPQETNSVRLSSLAKALAGFAARMNPSEAASLAARGATVLAEAPETYSNPSSNLADALVALAALMNPEDAASVAAHGATLLARALETKSYNRPSNLGALAAFAARMNPDDAAEVATVLAKVLENPQETNSERLSGLANALPVLAARMNPSEAASIATGVAQALENPQETNSERLSSLANALAGFAARMNPDDAAEVATVLAKVLENPQETNSDRLSSLANALPVLVARMNPDGAASVVTGISKALENETNSDRVSSLADALSAVAAQIPSARQMQLVALSKLFLEKLSSPLKDGIGRENKAQDGTGIAKICSLLNFEELAEVLKWPFCVGEAQKIVFTELETKIKQETRQSFAGDVWKFVEQVDLLGIKGLDRKFLDKPAKRPPKG